MEVPRSRGKRLKQLDIKSPQISVALIHITINKLTTRACVDQKCKLIINAITLPLFLSF